MLCLLHVQSDILQVLAYLVNVSLRPLGLHFFVCVDFHLVYRLHNSWGAEALDFRQSVPGLIQIDDLSRHGSVGLFCLLEID